MRISDIPFISVENSSSLTNWRNIRDISEE